MYRAKVEVVDGWRVRAGGKWLTCIGNKNVRVGEMIWTDGRCVYGNYKESSQPIVVTTQNMPQDFVIPIQNGNLCCYFSDKLYTVGNLPSGCNRIVNNKKILFSSVGTSTIDIYESKIVVLSANCDKAGNVFEFSVAQNEYISITLNQNEVHRISLKEDEFVIWGFVADINNWAYIVYSTEYNQTQSAELIAFFWEMAKHDKADNEATGGWDYPLETYYNEVYWNSVDYYGGDYDSYTYAGKMTFVNSQGQKIDFVSFDCAVSRELQWGRSGYHFNAEHVDSYSLNYDNMSTIKFPMHDDFYFTMQNPIIFYRDVIGFPYIVEKSIYSPEGKKIFSDYFGIQTNFSACKINSNSHLIVTFSPNTYLRIPYYLLEGIMFISQQLDEFDEHTWGYRFWADTAWILNYSDNEIIKIRDKTFRNSTAVFLVASDGNASIQDWQHLGYNLRKTPKNQLIKWLRQNTP